MSQLTESEYEALQASLTNHNRKMEKQDTSKPFPFTPTRDNIVLRLPDAGKLYLNNKDLKKIAQEKGFEVVAVGPNVDTCKAGDRVFFANGNMFEITVDGNQYFTTQSYAIVGVFND